MSLYSDPMKGRHMGTLTQSHAHLLVLETTAELESYLMQQREIVFCETRRRRGCLLYFLLASFEYCPILFAKYKFFGKGSLL